MSLSPPSIAVSPYGDLLRDGRWHGVIPLAQGVSADQVAVIAAALKSLDPHTEIVSSRVTLADANGKPVVCDALKVTLASDPSDTLAAFVDSAQSLHRVQHITQSEPSIVAKFFAKLIPSKVKELAAPQLDTPAKRERAAILGWMGGDLFGIGIGVANKDARDLRFGGLSLLSTIVGLAGGNRHKGFTRAERVIAELEEQISPNHRLATPDYAPDHVQTVAGAGQEAIEKISFPALWGVSAIGSANLTQAGIAQKDPFKIFSGLLLNTAQAIVLFKRQEGRKGLVDFEALGKNTGVTGIVEAAAQTEAGRAVTNVAEKTGIAEKLREGWNALHENPRAVAGRLLSIHSMNMWLVSGLAWVRGPAEMRSIRANYGEQGRRAASDAVAQPERFNPDANRPWWTLSSDEAKVHLEALASRKDISPAEYTRFEHDVETYFKRKRFMKGGLLNVGMISAYTFANTTIGSSSDLTQPDVQEIFADAARLIERTGEENRAQRKAQIIATLADRPEIWENKGLAALLGDQSGKDKQAISQLVSSMIDQNLAHLRKAPTAAYFAPV